MKVNFGLVPVVWTPAGDEPATFMVMPVDDVERIRRVGDWQGSYTGPPPMIEQTLEDGTVKRVPLPRVEDIEWQVNLVTERCQSWAGIEDESGPLPCSPENRKRVFAKYGEARNLVLDAILNQGAAKNASGGGSNSSSSTPESPAERSTITGPPAPTTTV